MPLAVCLTAVLTAESLPAQRQAWPLWEAFAAKFVDAQGRVIDWHREGKSTSEGQAYAMFFALVANDRPRFDRILKWTEQNLAAGDLEARLPAWLWGRAPDNAWRVLDENPASDADLWLVYDLLQAGELWSDPRYTALGQSLARRVQGEEVAVLPGFGPMVLPAPRGFRPRPGLYQLNPSYVPLQVLLGLSAGTHERIWKDVAALVPRLVQASAPNGFALDWIAYQKPQGFAPEPVPGKQPGGSYDAARVYLWAGMLHPETPHRGAILKSLRGMQEYLRQNALPPTEVSPAGTVRDGHSRVGFSGAMLPFLAALRETAAERLQQQRLDAEFDAGSGLFGKEQRYYDQCLILFSRGWTERRFSFDARGILKVNWR